MTFTVIGLGNPGEEYEGSRHNVGRDAVLALAKKYDAVWSADKKMKALKANAVIGGRKAVLVLPEVFMNQSGQTAALFIKSQTAAKNLVVVHDELDLPLGSLRLVFARGAGGHKGVDSIMKHIKTRDFARIRIGVAPADRHGNAKKLKDGDKVVKLVLGEFKKDEQLVVKKSVKKAVEALEVIIGESFVAAINAFNSKE